MRFFSVRRQRRQHLCKQQLFGQTFIIRHRLLGLAAHCCEVNQVNFVYPTHNFKTMCSSLDDGEKSLTLDWTSLWSIKMRVVHQIVVNLGDLTSNQLFDKQIFYFRHLQHRVVPPVFAHRALYERWNTREKLHDVDFGGWRLKNGENCIFLWKSFQSLKKKNS